MLHHLLSSRAARAGLLACLLSTSALTAAHAGDLVPPKVMSTTPGGVNIADGGFDYSVTDLAIGPLALQRFYIGGEWPGPDRTTFGYHMTSNFDIFVASNIRVANQFFPLRFRPVVHNGKGSSGPYREPYSPNGTPYSSCCAANETDATGATLERASYAAPYIFTDHDGAVYTFSTAVHAGLPTHDSDSQRVSTIQYPNGRLLSFYYNATGQLKEVLDNTGYALIFDYFDSNPGPVTSACGFNLAVTSVSPTSTCVGATLKVIYNYGSGALASVTDVMGNVTTYDTSGMEVIGCIKPPTYSVCKFQNAVSDGMISSQTLADGSVWQFTFGGDYGLVHDPEVPPQEASSTVVTDPNNVNSEYYFYKTSPSYFIDANGHRTDYFFSGGHDGDAISQPVYPQGGILDEIDLPEGNKYLELHTSLNRLSRQTWKAKPGSSEAGTDIVVQYGYGSCPSSRPHPSCVNPIWIKDAKLNQTDFTYDATHGGILTKTLPADNNGLRTRTYTTYEAFNTGSGTIYRPIRTETCGLTSGQLTLTACPASVTTSVTVTSYGTSTTAPYTYKGFQPYTTTQTDGASTLSATTTYTYDQYGNAVIVDGPLSGTVDQSFKTYDLMHRVVCEIGPDPDDAGSLVRAMVRHTYDAPGRETLTETGTGTSTSSCLGTNMTVKAFTRKTYDGMDRVIKTEVGAP